MYINCINLYVHNCNTYFPFLHGTYVSNYFMPFVSVLRHCGCLCQCQTDGSDIFPRNVYPRKGGGPQGLLASHTLRADVTACAPGEVGATLLQLSNHFNLLHCTIWLMGPGLYHSK